MQTSACNFLCLHAEVDVECMVRALLARGGHALLHSRTKGGYHALHIAAANCSDGGSAIMTVLTALSADNPRLVRLQHMSDSAGSTVVNYHVVCCETNMWQSASAGGGIWMVGYVLSLII